MQISRHLLLASAVAVCLSPSLVHALDNEAQIRARQALEEKMNQTNTQPPAPAVVVTNPAPKVVVTQPAPVQKPSGTQIDLHQALDEKMNQLNAQQPAPAAVHTNPPPKAVVAQPAPAPKPTPPVVTVTPQTTPVEPVPQMSQPVTSAPAYVTTPSNDSATSDKLSGALHQKMQEAGSQPAETPAPVVVTQKPAKPAKVTKPAPVQPETKAVATTPAPTPTPTPAPATSANFTPLPEGSTTHPALPEQPTPAPVMTQKQSAQPTPPTMSLPALTGPPSSLSPAKQQKLDELLQQYRADQLTPQQYHEQRAKVLAEP